MLRIFKIIQGDKAIWTVVIILSIFSVLAVYSSTGTLAYKYQSGNTEYYLFKHLGILIMGLISMYLAHLIKYTYYAKIAQIGIILVIPLLFYTLFFGTSLNEATRWIILPIINLTIQTSDIGKLILLMYVARLLSKKQDEIKDLKSAFIPIILPILIVCGLILPANFSTAAILFVTSLILLFIGRIKIKYILAIIGIGIVFLSLFILIIVYSTDNKGRIQTWENRIESYINGDSESNYQTEQAKIAIARGGIIGKFPGKSTQRNFLPHPYSDFIFAIIIEEYGLIGGMVIVLMYLIILYRGVQIVKQCPGTFGAFLTIGVCISLVFQAFVNMAVAVNLLPVTGQPLPLVSMGGTSIWFTSLSIGIMLSVSKGIMKEKPENQRHATA
ncbi:FtsW/RodA/SpoVE family cell cycle protein [candidate division KSB1 bacterium]